MIILSIIFSLFPVVRQCQRTNIITGRRSPLNFDKTQNIRSSFPTGRGLETGAGEGGEVAGLLETLGLHVDIEILHQVILFQLEQSLEVTVRTLKNES